MLSSFLVSAGVVAVAELGDRTQLLTLLLVARWRRPWPIVAGILVATLLNHALAAAVGQLVAGFIPEDILRWVLGLSFIAMALWALKPDDLDETPAVRSGLGTFLATTVLFFLVEMGDKTQLATAALAARYDHLVLVTAGTTLGMMIANAPVAFGGEALIRRLPLRYIRWSAAALLAVIGVLTLVTF
ncbi:MAG TPA: TMEM165/GDT1 family protein [Sphingomonadales bacterium]